MEKQCVIETEPDNENIRSEHQDFRFQETKSLKGGISDNRHVIDFDRFFRMLLVLFFFQEIRKQFRPGIHAEAECPRIADTNDSSLVRSLG